MKRLTVLSIAVMVLAGCATKPAPKTMPSNVEARPQLVPLPQHMEFGEGGFALAAGTSIHASEAFKPTADVLAAWIGMALSPDMPKVEVLRDGTPVQAIVLRQVPGTSELGTEGYSLEVTATGITLSAATPAG